MEDRFFLISGWRDLAWTNVKVMRDGLDVDERDSRELIFGKNVIDIQQKSVPQLLVDEVGLLLFLPWIVGRCLTDKTRLFILFISSKSPV